MDRKTIDRIITEAVARARLAGFTWGEIVDALDRAASEAQAKDADE